MISIIEPDNTDENSDWIKIVIYKRLEKDKKVLSEKDIEKSVKIAILDVVAKWWEGRKFKHPETEHMVLFKSLPVDEQKRLNDMVKEKKKEKTKEKPKEEDLSKMLKDVAEGVQERKADTMNAIAKRLSQDELQKLLKMKPSWLGTIKAVIVQRVDQIGLKMMMKDELYLTRETVASRIDLKELPNMMNDEDSAVRYAVSKRIDYKNLLKMIKNEKRNSGLKERMEERRMRMEFIGLNTIEEFKKTGNFNMDTILLD